jgi:hypothetical protein
MATTLVNIEALRPECAFPRVPLVEPNRDTLFHALREGTQTPHPFQVFGPNGGN